MLIYTKILSLEGEHIMAQAFEIPSNDSYMKMYSNLVGETDGIMVGKCISQCTGCKCSCDKGIEYLEIEW